MKKIYLILLLCFWSNTSFAKINIFTCLPEWSSLAQEIAQDKANIFSATNHNEDPHYVQAKPSLIAKIRNADLVFCSGASLEEGWLPLLLQKTYKTSTKKGEIGYFMASDFVEKLEVINDKSISRAMGHIHPQGNPHIHLNPHNIAKVAQEFTRRLKIIDPDNSEFFENNYQEFSKKWQLSIKKWQKKAENLKKMPIIVQHNAWSYLIDWIDLDLVAQIEDKPGVSPSGKHLEKLIDISQNNKIDLIIYTSFEESRYANWLSKKTGIKSIEAPFTINKPRNINNLFDLFDAILSTLQVYKSDQYKQK